MKYLVICALVILSGCSNRTVPDSPTPVTVTTIDTVAHCRMVGDVFGASGLYGAFVEKGMTKARAEALVKVRRLGGNTVVWTAAPTVTGSTIVAGNAYACP